ncbi:hypothetical protein KI387_007103, partial [Taxus chinensis]
ADLDKKEEELLEKSKDPKQQELISAQLRRELKQLKIRVREISMKVDMITYAIILKYPDLAPPEKKYGSTLQCLEDLNR